MSDEALQIRSFRVVFDLERRIHRIDRFRVPLPYGLPLRSLGYAVVALLGVLVVESLPIVGPMLVWLPTPARLVLLPVAISYALTRVRVDGRSAHAAGRAWMRHAMSARRLAAFKPVGRSTRVVLGDVTFAADVSAAASPGWTERSVEFARRAFPLRRARQQRTEAGEQLVPGSGEQLVMW